jgi:hypothetical protein
LASFRNSPPAIDNPAAEGILLPLPLGARLDRDHVEATGEQHRIERCVTSPPGVEETVRRDDLAPECRVRTRKCGLQVHVQHGKCFSVERGGILREIVLIRTAPARRSAAPGGTAADELAVTES